MTFRCGPTLATPTPALQTLEYVNDRVGRGKVLGSALLVLSRGPAIDLIDIDCALDNVDPAQAVQMMRIAQSKLRDLHHLAIGDEADSAVIRREAETLVEFIRKTAGNMTSREESVHRVFTALRNARRP